jgi:tRNA(Ile)-lysidine synthase
LRRPAAAVAADPAGDVTAPARFDAAWLRVKLRAMIGALRARQLCVAYSGGLDSGALLSALAQLRTRERFGLRAVHVDHGIQPQSALWARAACARARALRVPCRVLELSIERSRGESLEALARDARYRALAAELAPDELLLTAHHQEDQLETVLLALLRGSGVRGLAAMSAVTPWAHTLLLRPLLPVTRAQLEHYVRARALDWSEDPSNADLRFDRNYLRGSVLPLIRQRWPAAAATVSRSAAHLAEARRLLEQLAMTALKDARDGAAVRVSVLRRLPLPQRRNAVQLWIAERGLPPPDHRRLHEICGPLLAARGDSLPKVSWRGAELRRHADRLFACSVTAQRTQPAVERWDWRAQPWLRLAGGGALGLVRDLHGDVYLPALPPLLSVHHRHGGERVQGREGRVALKDLLQERGIAPWQRAIVPLVVHAGRIIAVADLWLDGSYGCRDAGAGERGRFRWRREACEFDDYD